MKMKKLISMIIASAMVFSGASALLIQSVFAEGMSLPPISGTTRIDTEAGDGVTGGTVVITNTGDSAQSVGDLGALLPSANFFSAEPEAENSGKLDFAMPVDDVPVADPAIPNLNALPEAYAAPAERSTKEFWITNPINYSGTPKEFTLLKEGINCLIWAEASNDYQVDGDMAKTIAEEFDRSYPTLQTNFGSFWDKDGSGKVNVLMYDIQDGNNPAGYIAGFFYAADFTNANKSQIIHIDTYPSIYRTTGSNPRVSNAFSTIVHEMQHMINYSNSANNSKPKMPDWLNEALSMAAEEMIYPNSSIPSRLWTYNADRGGMITNGKSVLVFDNSLESYALSCLFSAYLKSQTDSSVFSRIIDNYAGDAKDAIVKALDRTALGGLNFGDVLSAYRIALARNDTSGIYGFNSDPALASISQHIYAGNNITLPAGGAITVKPAAGTFSPSGSGTDIKFMGISEFTGAPIIQNKPADMVVDETHLLTGTGDGDLTWASSNTAVAEIDQTGNITAKAVGTTTITLSNDLSSDSFVLAVKGTSITIKPFATTIMVGANLQLEAVTRPAGGAVKWTSSNEGAATIGADGKLTAVAAGTTNITATIDRTTVTATVTVTVVIATTTTYPGLEVDFGSKVINIISDEGIDTLSGILRSYTVEFGYGLINWTVNQLCPITLRDFTPMGFNGNPGVNGTNGFSGTYNGNNQNITLIGFDRTYNSDFGIFTANRGTINNINLVITEIIDFQTESGYNTYPGIITPDNYGTINNANVVVTDTGGGINGGFVNLVCNNNYGTVNNTNITNHGTFQGMKCFVGVIHTNEGVVNNASFYSDGTIIPEFHISGIVGNNAFSSPGWITGDINVTFAVGGIAEATAQVGADIGAVASENINGNGNVKGHIGNRTADDNTRITVRIDCEIKSNGEAAGVIGVSGFNVSPDQMPFVSVTVGPEGKILKKNGECGGVVANVPMTPDELKKVAYAVPYDSPYYAFPTNTPADQGAYRIEYPKIGNPAPTILINPPQNVINSADATAPNGVFIKKDALITPSAKPLLVQSAFDDEIFNIDLAAQIIDSKYQTKENYYDFNMLADGIPIVVPAYLNVQGRLAPPAMTLNITGARVYDSADEATADPGFSREEVTISARNGRIESFTVTKDDSIPYTGSISMVQNTDLLKKFSMADRGLYKITATGTPLGSSAPQIVKTKYLRIGGIPAITIVGQHLTGLQTETWTNLKDSQPTPLTELATAEAHATTIEELTVTKGAVPYQLYPGDYVTAADITAPAKRSFKLMETGRYVLTAKGVGLPIPAVKYVNIDVDRPMPPIVDLTKARAADIPITLPTESVDQSPIHAEYKVDDGAFTPVMGGSVPLQGKKITLRTVDLAGNISDEIIIQLCTVTVTPEPANGGTVTGGGSYLLVGRNVNGTITYDRDTFATIKATPASGYKFDKWTDGTGEYNTAEYVFKVVGDADFVAHFSGLPIDPPAPPASSEPSIPPDPILPGVVTPTEDYVKLEYIPKEGGTVEGKSPQYIRRYTDGESVTAKAKPSYRFVTWSDGVKTATRKDLRVANDITVYALFELIPQEKPIAPPNVVRPPKTGSINWTPLLVTAMLSSLGTLIFCSTKLIYVRKKCS